METKIWLDKIPGLKGKDARQGFIKKVYAMVIFIISFPTILIIVSVCVDSVRSFMDEAAWLYYTVSMVLLVMLFGLFCFHGILRKTPLNYIYLCIFTILETYIVSALTCTYDPKLILFACILTLMLVVLLNIYSCATNSDLKGIWWALLWSTIGITLTSIVIIAIIRDYYAFIVLFWLLLIVFAFYLIVDTQMIADEKYREISLDDSIIASMMLFIDYVSVLIYLLLILGGNG